MGGFYSHGRVMSHLVYTDAMQSKVLTRLGLASRWSQELSVALIALGLGFGIMPLLIYWAGSSLLGRYEGANAARIYDGVYQGLETGSIACAVVVFGPYVLYLAFKLLFLGWRSGARSA